MSLLKNIKILLLLAVVFAACTEPYSPPEQKGGVEFLVVDGFLNATSGTASVRLSKAIPLSNTGRSPVIRGASVSIISDNGAQIPLLEQAPFSKDSGVYLVNFPVDATSKYKLRISSGQGVYESDFVNVEVTSPIEDLYWETDNNDLTIKLTTGERNDASKFYRWKYSEAYEYVSPFFSAYILENRGVRRRTPEEEIYRCYRNDPAYGINIASAEDLSANVIRNREMLKIPRSSIKLSQLYSINVEQYALSEESYTYWLNLFKTSEDLGGLFDPMPYQLVGNLHSVNNNNEVVIGYFSASTVEEKRIFIKHSELPVDFPNYHVAYCLADTIFVEDVPDTPPSTLLTEQFAMGIFVIGYGTATNSCIDCRSYGGGVLTKPDFWP